MRPADVARVLECGRSSVFKWIALRRDDGESGLSVKVASGRPPKLSPRQHGRLRALLQKNPQQLGFDFRLWTRAMVADLIRREFDVSLSLPSTGRLLRGMGMSPQRPLVRAHEQNPESVRRWKEEVYPAIRNEAAAQGAVVLFADEAGIRSDHHSGTTGAPVGKTPVVAGTGRRVSINMISAISAQGALRFSMFDGSMNAEKFIGFLRDLLHDITGKIYLVVDGSPAHTAKKIAAFIDSAEADGRLRMFFLPPCSPQLNPDEWVWKNVKHDQVGRTAIYGLGDLMAAAGKALLRLQNTPETVRAFFGDAHLAYIKA